MSWRPGRRPAAAIPRRRRCRPYRLLWIAGLVTASAAWAQAEVDTPSAVPYRPSLSTPAALTVPGWIEIEAGFEHDHAGPAARQDRLPFTLKLAFTEDWGIRLGSDGWVRQRDEGGAQESGYGDTAIVLKRRFAVDETQAFGIEAGVVFATARKNLGSGSGKTDFTLTGIYSADLGAWHTDLNVAAARLGNAAEGASRNAVLWAAALSRGLGGGWGMVGEFAGSRQGGEAGERQFLLAVSYNVSPRLVLDAGAARSLRSGSAQWSAFTGFTWLVGRVF